MDQSVIRSESTGVTRITSLFMDTENRMALFLKTLFSNFDCKMRIHPRIEHFSR